MKKIMIAFAAIAVAASLNASQFAWGFSSGEITTHEGGENWLEGGTALLYLGTVTYDAVTGWNIPDTAVLLGTADQDPNNYNFGPFSTAKTNPSNDAVIADGNQAYTLILTEESGVTGITKDYEGWVYIENGTAGTDAYMDGTDSIKVATMRTATDVGGSMWTQAQAVPEPTSGLLLLLGMAGLALKRKRA